LSGSGAEAGETVILDGPGDSIGGVGISGCREARARPGVQRVAISHGVLVRQVDAIQRDGRPVRECPVGGRLGVAINPDSAVAGRLDDLISTIGAFAPSYRPMPLTVRSALTSLVRSARRPSARPRRGKPRSRKRLRMSTSLSGRARPSLLASVIGDRIGPRVEGSLRPECTIRYMQDWINSRLIKSTRLSRKVEIKGRSVLLIVKILYAVHDFTTDFVARC
jgi:hypothetical protein